MTLDDQAALELTVQGASVSQVLGLIRNIKTGNKRSFHKISMSFFNKTRFY